MPIHDAPFWDMPAACKGAAEEVAPSQRTFLRSLIKSLREYEHVGVNDAVSCAGEILASQVNLLADMLKERNAEIRSPERAAMLGDDAYLNIIISDIFNRAQLRRLRGADE